MRVFKLPDLGEGLQEAEIVTWHVKAGDTVAADQPLLSVETAKAIVEIPSPYAGTVGKLSFELKVSPELMWTGLKWALAIGFIGGLFPAVRAARLPVTTALREL